MTHPLTAILPRAFATSETAVRAASDGKWGMQALELVLADHWAAMRAAEHQRLASDCLYTHKPGPTGLAEITQAAIMEVMQDGVTRTTAELAAVMGVKVDSIREDLNRLHCDGILRRDQYTRNATIRYTAYPDEP